LWQKTLFYLGLVDEDEAAAAQYAAAEDTGESERRRPTGEQPTAAPAEARPEPRRTQPNVARVTSPIQPSVAGRRVEPPLTARRRITGEHEVTRPPAETQTVRTLKDTHLESEIITATSYSDAQQLADHIRASIPVVLDLRTVEPAMVRRLVDFASGLTYALSGSMRKIGQGVILVTPANVNISRDERRRLADLGYYQAPESG
jgi:cell division inhibitor SepF